MRKHFTHKQRIIFILSTLIAISIALPTNAAKIEELIPANSIVYVTVRDLEDVWGAIEESENWRTLFETPAIKGKIDELNQGIQMLQLMLGTDPHGIVETFGYQIALTVFPGDPEPMIGVIVNTGGAIREAERLVTGLGQMAGTNENNRVETDAGNYRNIAYHTMQLDELSLTYAFVDDLLVVGVNDGSFEAMIDTYKKERQSIRKNDSFKRMTKKFADTQLLAYVNADAALPLITADMDDNKLREFRVFGFDSLQTLVVSLDLLNVGGGLQLHGKIKQGQQNGIIGLLLQEGQPLQSVQALSGEEDLFIAIAPSSSEAIWQFVETLATAEDGAGEFYDGVAEVERVLSLDLETDVVGALTGEVALWGDLNGEIGSIDGLMDLFNVLDAAIVAGLKSPSKWNVFLDSIQNLINASIQQYDYKGTTLHQLPFPPDNPQTTVRYGQVNRLFLVSFTDERFESVVDNTSTKGAVGGFKKRLKSLPATPTIVLRLRLDSLLPTLMTSREEKIDPSPEAMRQMHGMEALLGTLSVKGDEAWLKIAVPSEEMIETLGKVAALIGPAVAK